MCFFGLGSPDKTSCDIRFALRLFDDVFMYFLIQLQSLPGRADWLLTPDERSLQNLCTKDLT